MQAARLCRRASRALSDRVFLHSLIVKDASLQSSSSSHCRTFRTFSIQNDSIIGIRCSNGGFNSPCDDFRHHNPKVSMTLTAPFCSATASSSDTVKEVYDKILESIKVKKSAPPNAWLWSLIEKCKSRDDIKLLFSVLQQLRIFRLSNLRIHDNFNCNLCQEVAKACVRAGAVDYGKKALWAHNVYGLTPTVGSANQILSYAKAQKDVNLLEDMMSLLKKNELPLQPATADIVFSICYNADNWKLISKYSRWFVKAGVKLRKTAFDVWMEFASTRGEEKRRRRLGEVRRGLAEMTEGGDLKSLWKIEKLRSDSYKQHTIKSGFSCAKGFLLEKKPDSAASVIQDLSQSFPDAKRQDINDELQRLVNEWPTQVIKHQKQEDQKALIAILKAGIPALLSSLSSSGLNSNISVENLNVAEPVTF